MESQERPVLNSDLAHLKESVARAVEFLRALQTENASLRQTVLKLQHEVEELKSENQEKYELIHRFKNNRLRIRSRVERAIKKVAALENPAKESIEVASRH